MRGYGEQLGDALQDILNPPAPHVYFVKHVRDGLEWEGWERINITVGRYIDISARRSENGQDVRMAMAVAHQSIEYDKYPRDMVLYVLAQFAHSLDKWRAENHE